MRTAASGLGGLDAVLGCDLPTGSCLMDREEQRFVSRKFTIEAKTISLPVESGWKHLIPTDMESAVGVFRRDALRNGQVLTATRKHCGSTSVVTQGS